MQMLQFLHKGYSGIPANDFTRGSKFYDLVITVDPTNDAIFYVGRIDILELLTVVLLGLKFLNGLIIVDLIV